jgi:hypothetical protein
MSKSREAASVSKSTQIKDQPQGAGADAPPLRPRPKLFALMAVVLVLLLAGLLTLYFKTVYPIRNLPHAVETDKADEPGR